MEKDQSDRARVRALNDEMRTQDVPPKGAQRWLLTPGVVALSSDGGARAIVRVQRFDEFDADNDPHGEHDFGSFELDGQTLFWKIDYYNPTLDGGSANPADPSVTTRVLTIMLASEY